MFNIGDKVWFVRSGQREKWITCPHCFGNKKLTVILGDGTQIGMDCACCDRGWMGSWGEIAVYEWDACVLCGLITSVELCEREYKYRTDSCYCADHYFFTKEEAEAEQLILEMQHIESEKQRIHNKKEYASKSWAWNATYHRRQLKNAQRDIEYHSTKLELAKSKSKEEKSV